jgi:hypothetical protein
MSTATATPSASINLNALGIQEMDKYLQAGKTTVYDILQVLNARIDKRIAEKRPLLRPVVEYRNKLADAYECTTGFTQTMVPVPTYTKAQPNAALPNDPEQLADVVFATVGAANVGKVIARLTARIVSA